MQRGKAQGDLAQLNLAACGTTLIGSEIQVVRSSWSGPGVADTRPSTRGEIISTEFQGNSKVPGGRRD